MLKKISLKDQVFKFRDGQEVRLSEPTLLQLKNTNKISDNIEKSKSLLVDVSNGELTSEFLDSLPSEEFMRLQEMITGFLGIDEKN